MPDPDTTIDRIDETLTYYSAGLGEDITVPVGDAADLMWDDNEPDRARVLHTREEVFQILAREMSRVVGGFTDWANEHLAPALARAGEQVKIVVRMMGPVVAAHRAQQRHLHVTYSQRLRARRRRPV